MGGDTSAMGGAGCKQLVLLGKGKGQSKRKSSQMTAKPLFSAYRSNLATARHMTR